MFVIEVQGRLLICVPAWIWYDKLGLNEKIEVRGDLALSLSVCVCVYVRVHMCYAKLGLITNKLEVRGILGRSLFLPIP